MIDNETWISNGFVLSFEEIEDGNYHMYQSHENPRLFKDVFIDKKEIKYYLFIRKEDIDSLDNIKSTISVPLDKITIIYEGTKEADEWLTEHSTSYLANMLSSDDQFTFEFEEFNKEINMNTNLIENYIQKIIDLTDSNCLVWEQDNSYCGKIYRCKWCGRILTFSQFVDSICNLTINDVEYSKQDNECDSILHSLGKSIKKQINTINEKRFVEQLQFLNEIEVPIKKQ